MRLFNTILLSLLLLCSSLSAQQLLNNTGFEGAFISVAPSWHQITFGSPSPVVTYSKETSIFHSGISSQKITINSLGNGATMLVQDFDFTAAEIYEGSIWLRSDDSIKIVFMFQERVPFYYVPASYIKTIGPAWEQLTIQGGYKSNLTGNPLLIEGRFVIQPLDTGVIYIDEGSLVSTTSSVQNAPVTNNSEVPASYFGMHVNKLGVHEIFPPLGFGTMRLWNTGTEWQQIEPLQGLLTDTANWIYDASGNSGFAFRLDYYVNYILGNDSSHSIIYTMGQSPSWAATSVTQPPQSIADWQNYISILANRFHSKIKYWEIWNEVDYSGSYSGSTEELVALTQTAYSELKTVDSTNIVLSPNFTSAEGLAAFLTEGGGSYVDVFSWHCYPTRTPEDMIPEIVGMKNVIANYGFANKPLWNTEGAVSVAAVDTLTEAESIAAVSRSYIIQWLFGVENFNWYCWDVYGDFSRNFAELSYSSIPGAYDSLTSTGIAYRETAEWMKGAQVISKSFSNNVWTVELQRSNGYRAYIVWSTNGLQQFSIPSAWNIVQMKDLYAVTSSLTTSSIQISQLPLLLENTSTVSTEEKIFLSKSILFPNPASEKIILYPFNSNDEISITSVNGHALDIPATASGNYLELDVKALPAGMYFIRCKKQGMASFKFIKD